MHDFLFVLEQTLGHVAHTRNLERVLASEPDLKARCLHLEFDTCGWKSLPGLRNWSFRASWMARRWMGRQVTERRPDAIFIHTQVASLLAPAIMRRVPTIVSLDATPANFDVVGAAYSHRTSNPLLESAKRAINRRSMNAAAGLVTWCEWARDSLTRDYGVPKDKVRVIAPGVDLELFKPSPRRSDGRVRLLFVGGNLERKGGLELLSALSLVHKNVELDLVTTSPMASIPPGVTVRVHDGLKPQSAGLVRLFREADIFVMPTRGDAFPQVIAEAMACRLPVISTPVGAIREVVLDGQTGLLVAPRSPGDLAEAISALAGDRHRREAMGHAGFELARRKHDMARNNREILALLREVAARPLREAAAV